MKIKTKLSVLFFLLCFLKITMQAQEVVTSSGGYGTTASAKLTWTIGEPITETAVGTNTMLTQGFNQGDLIITLIRNSEIPDFILKVFPNPTNDHLRISAGNSDPENLKYVLIDLGGKVLIEKNLTGKESDISVGNLSPSTYFLKVYQNNKEIKVFKIVKK